MIASEREYFFKLTGFKIGQLVFLRSDPAGKFPGIVSSFLETGDSPQVAVARLDSMGVSRIDLYPPEGLLSEPLVNHLKCPSCGSKISLTKDSDL